MVAVDLSPKLVALAQERLPRDLHHARLTFFAGDMLDPSLGTFDHAVAMDSLIHYKAEDMAEAVARLAARVSSSLVFTHAPRTPALSVMHAVGKLFPRGDKSPAIEPVSSGQIQRLVAAKVKLTTTLPGHGRTSSLGRSHRIASGFYISQAQEVVVA